MATPFAEPYRLRVFVALLGIVMASAQADMAAAAQARLVRCGAETCLRLVGHRYHNAVAVRIAGQDIAAEGGRAWHATVPLSRARTWPIEPDGTLRLILADRSTGAETVDAALPPTGALGRHVQLATLLVRAH